MPFDDNKLYCSEVLSILLQNHEGELQRDCVYTRVLTFSLPIPVRLYTLPYWSNPQFLIIDIRALWRSVLSARAPECQKLKIVG